MTLVLIGPVCEDLIIIGEDRKSNVGGASFYQSFVYDEYYNDYLVIANASNEDLIDSFPDSSKARLIIKDDTHHFINEYPDSENLDIRNQSTNFADIPILSEDLENIFAECEIDDGNIDAFVLTPLNSNDFPIETLKFLKSFDVPIYVSLQGFLRFMDDDGSLILKLSDNIKTIFEISDTIFMDESEFDIIKCVKFEGPRLLITNGSKGSRIIDVDGQSIKINAVKCNIIKDTTGSGDTYMSAYISAILNNKNYQNSADFASLIASEKLKNFGPYKKL